jgi:hypothetical protein
MVFIANNCKFITDFNIEPSVIGAQILILKVDRKISMVEN